MASCNPAYSEGFGEALRRDRQVLKPIFLAFLAVVAMSGATLAQDSDVTPLDATSQAWAAPVPPFRIADNLFYVGAADITSYVVATREGLILIDGGFAQMAPQIVANLHALGFDIHDVRIILTTHAHYDHVGAIAELKRLSGAQLYVSAADAEQMARGGHGDFAFGDRFLYPPVQADHILHDGEVVRLGEAHLIAHVTPGHTRGCTTWSIPLRVGERTLSAVDICSVTAPGYRLSRNAAYPNIVSDFRATFRRLSDLQCDIPLGSHGNFFDLTEKRRRLQRPAQGNPFVDPAGCRRTIENAQAAFEAQLARQQQAPAP